MIAHRRIDGAVVACSEIERLLEDEPASNWLSAVERAAISAMRHEPARKERLAGRILAKMLVLRQLADEAAMTSCSPHQVQIDSRDGLGRRIAPRVSRDGRWLNCSLSISHAGSIVAAVLSTEETRPVGVDVTNHAADRQGTLSLWLTAAEQRVAAESGVEGAVRLWNLKEAAFKALAEGRHFRPLQWDVSGCLWQSSDPGGEHGSQSRGTQVDECNGNRYGVAGVRDCTAVDDSRFHADSVGEPRVSVTAPVGESANEPHDSQSRGTRSGTSESDGVVTSDCRHTSTGHVRMLTARGWMTRPVDIHMWNAGDALICVVRARTNTWSELPADDQPADTFTIQIPRPRLPELSGC
ncbi:hypothetical protein Mal4_48570 [Maioricimonas rarisocia]|uniref:4'-phosphopantetheinyl transferase domain-containing protein n=1 Tax=Maioricimonas rarisocia TaxID=2528026 RepID=A0A517ZDF3_9PLAN|nr:4'-phosphopantetheinyl transferase superfamily protein [Maioricimonas rarisocia]QDU40499.1 hypothetical protein Mal4_48570 [Maioricimonas rarisocia]